MATISISGTNKLAERIVSEAEAQAQIALEESGATIRAIQAENEKTAAQKRAELRAKRESTIAGVIAGYETRASLEGGKSALAKKRAMIDRVFSGAYQALIALDAHERGRICERMLRTEAEGGETIVPAAKDRAAIVSVLAKLPEKSLILSKENASVDGGFLLIADGYEKDCSFASLLNLLRSEEETSVAKLLFD